MWDELILASRGNEAIHIHLYAHRATVLPMEGVLEVAVMAG